MNSRLPFALALAVVASFFHSANGQEFGFDGGLSKFGKSEPLTVSSWYELTEGSQEGKLFVKAVMGRGYHVYSQHHKAVGIPTSMSVTESQAYQAGGTFVPDRKPHVSQKDGEAYEEFERQVTWSTPIQLADTADPATTKIKVTFRGMVCNATGCRPPKTENMDAEFAGYKPDLGVDATEVATAESPSGASTSSTETPSLTPEVVAAPKLPQATGDSADALAAMAKLYSPETKIKYEKLDGSSGIGTFWAALFGAFVGGMLLNLMPCVFPVLGLKVLGFVEQAGNDPKKIKLHGIAFAAGLIFSMWCLAGAILAIKSIWGQEVNWGQQMGNPYFVGAIVILLFVLGLNLAGVFEMGLFMSGVGGGKKQEGYSGSFISGIITTLIATPCSGPFLGAAMGYTLAQPTGIAMFLFTVFGLGIAVPYLVLSFTPSLIKLLPRPGEWMETFKKLMAFSLFAAAAFFVKSFGAQTGVDGLSWYLLALCVIALAAFFYGKWSPSYVKGSKRYIWGWAAPVLIASVGIWMYLDAAKIEAPMIATEDGWELWVPGRVEQKLAKGQAVWVDYTADW